MIATRYDIVELLAQIASERPAFGEDYLTKEQVAWAVGALERHGIHPNHPTIKAVLGRGRPQETAAYLAEIYAERARTLAKTPPDDPELQEAYTVMRRHARRRVEREMHVERAELDQRTAELEEAGRTLKQAEDTADEKLRAAELLRETLSKELDEGRQERVQLVLSLAAATGELADAKASLASVQQQVRNLSEEQAGLQSLVEGYRTEFVESAAKIAALDSAARSSATERGKLESCNVALLKNADRLAGEVASERQHNQLLKLRDAELSNQVAKLGNALSQANSRLGRERSSRENLQEQLHALRQQASAEKTEMRKMARALEASERERRDLLAKLAPDAKRSGRPSTPLKRSYANAPQV